MLTGLVLAAGAGRRMGGPKAELLVDGVRLVDAATALLLDGGCDEVVAVVRSAALDIPRARAVVNPEPERGMGSSLRLGLQAARGEACVIVLVDLVGITASDVRRLVELWQGGTRSVVVARRGGFRSHPVLVAREAFWEFAGVAEAGRSDEARRSDDVGRSDEGGRSFIDAHPDRVAYLDLAGEIFDLDTVSELERHRLGGR